MPIPKKFLVIFSIIFAISQILGITDSYCKFKKVSPEEWVPVLRQIGVKDELRAANSLSGISDTIQKIQYQKKNGLTVEEWIEIFKKLGIEPKQDMTSGEWLTIFGRLGLEIADKELFAEEIQKKTYTSRPKTPKPAKPIEKVSVSTGKSSTTTPEINEKSAKISLDLKEADIFSALKLISKKSGLIIVARTNVRGKVTIYLEKIDALDALEIILEMNDLAYIKEDNIVKVMTAQDYEKIFGKKFNDKTIVEVIRLKYTKVSGIEKTISSLKSKVGRIIPDSSTNSLILIDVPENIDLLKKLISNLDLKLETRIFALNYAKPSEVAESLKNTLSPEVSIAQVDERNSQIVITDYPEKVKEISELIESMDKRHQEVLIEAKIVQILLNDQFKMGVNWEGVFSKINEDNIPGKVIGNLSALPLGSSGVQLSIGTVEVNNFNAIFDLLQSAGKTNLVSSPRIATIENKEAKILVGTKEAYVTTSVTTSGSGVNTTAESVTFIDVGIKLFVTPNIGDDEYITMIIRPEVSSVDRTITTSQGNAIPIVRTTEAETTIMVKNGITIVIAGLMEEKKAKVVEGVPLLCKIPILGLPFRRTSYETVKTELAVFLTPHIMTGDVPAEDINK